MSHDSKLVASLEAAEGELTRRLLRCLPEASISGRNLFSNSEFNPYGLLQAHLDPDAEECLKLAHEALRLCERLDLPPGEGPAHLYLDACRQLADLSNPHRLGPRRLAKRVLAALARETAPRTRNV